MSRIPSLGPRGEGWVALQLGTMLLIVLAATQRPAVGMGDPTERTIAEAAGWVALAAGAVVVATSLFLLMQARALSAMPRPIETGVLVDAGPYRLIRHPVYAGLVLGSIGVGLVRLSPVTVALALVLFVILDVKRRREEAWLDERYDGYATYRSQTKALVPFIY